MKIKPLIVFSALTYFIIINASENSAVAQKRIDLKQVKKVMLIAKRGGFFANYFLRLDVKREGGKWICYQKQLYDAFNARKDQPANDTVEKRIGIISPRILRKIVRLLNSNDSTIDLKKFKIDRDELLKEIDSMDGSIGPKVFHLENGRRAQLEELIQADTIVEAAALEALHPMKMDDEDIYALRFIKDNNTISAEARSFAYPYHLPWRIGKRKYNNPQITFLFEKLRGDERYEKDERIRFHQEIDRRIYWDYFSKRRKKSFTFKNGQKN